jgi:3-isopropylmalate dehydrogenase
MGTGERSRVRRQRYSFPMAFDVGRDRERSEPLVLGYWAGEGIGPEIIPPTLRAVELALARQSVPVRWEPLQLGLEAFEETGRILPEDTWTTVTGLDGWILGPHDNARYPDEARKQQNPSAALRVRADLWANIRPVRGLPGSVAPDMDLIIVRENTEGMYADRNMYAGSGDVMVTEDVALAIGTFTRHGVRRIVEKAGRIAAGRGGVLTVAHKANVLARSSGMYLEEAEAMAARTGVELRPVHIDALCAELVTDPGRHRTIVAENMFGDILSDLAGALGGALGAAGSVNAGDPLVMAQAAHGSAPDIAGLGVANPAGVMSSAAQLLESLGLESAARDLSAAVREAIMVSPTKDVVAARAVGSGNSEVSGTADVSGVRGADGTRGATTAEFSETVFAQLGGLV